MSIWTLKDTWLTATAPALYYLLIGISAFRIFVTLAAPIPSSYATYLTLAALFAATSIFKNYFHFATVLSCAKTYILTMTFSAKPSLAFAFLHFFKLPLNATYHSLQLYTVFDFSQMLRCQAQGVIQKSRRGTLLISFTILVERILNTSVRNTAQPMLLVYFRLRNL